MIDGFAQFDGLARSTTADRVFSFHAHCRESRIAHRPGLCRHGSRSRSVPIEQSDRGFYSINDETGSPARAVRPACVMCGWRGSNRSFAGRAAAVRPDEYAARKR
jgi:hypothetical protein